MTRVRGVAPSWFDLRRASPEVITGSAGTLATVSLSDGAVSVLTDRYPHAWSGAWAPDSQHVLVGRESGQLDVLRPAHGRGI
jgi:hypothetical protein